MSRLIEAGRRFVQKGGPARVGLAGLAASAVIEAGCVNGKLFGVFGGDSSQQTTQQDGSRPGGGQRQESQSGARQAESRAGQISRVDMPRSLDDPDMKSYSLDDRAPKGVWYHPLHQPELWVAPRWDGAWSWGVSLMNNSDGAHVESHGDSGRVIVQVDEGRDQATLIVGAMTSDSYQGKNPANDYKWGTRGGRRVQNPDWAIGMWIRTQPGAEIAFYDPDSGQPLMKGDKQATVTANDRGDAGVILPNKGRVVARWTVTDPTKGTFESIVWFGPDDDPQSDQRINKVDVRAEARK